MLSFDDFAGKWKIDAAPLEEIVRMYPFRLNSYFEGLIRRQGDAIWRQVVPDPRELSDSSGLDDPLAEESLSPVPDLVHRYPNRVLWLVNDQCAVSCRFCTRKRKWSSGTPRMHLQQPECRDAPRPAEDLAPALHYIRRNPLVQDVLLSGGDPLLLPLKRLREILQKLREIKHVQIIRIGSRVPCALPQRITPELVALLAQFHPLYVNVHFNHPEELTPESERACTLMANAGIPIGSQTVLLRDINDSEPILAELFHRLLAMRVKPYYLMQMDLTRSTAHFRTHVSTALRILRNLRNRISGLAMPHFVIDLPGGHGKVALVPEAVREIGDGRMIVRNYLGKLCSYPLLEGEEVELRTEVGRWR
ncbi:MAG: KamA family radical SAM protein [Syntrophobacteraceae bacterium]